MSALMKPTATQWRRMRACADLCEAHAKHAAACSQNESPGAWLAHDSLARDYSRKAFALAREWAGEDRHP